MIKALQNSMGVLVDDPNELKSMAVEFYKNLYTLEGVNNIDQVLMLVPRKVSDEMNAMLNAPYT